jgi:hypothetical protein
MKTVYNKARNIFFTCFAISVMMALFASLGFGVWRLAVFLIELEL